MMREDIDDHILEGLIGIGYDMHIFDMDGNFPDGLDREEWERRSIDELFSQPEDSPDKNG